jgi:dihydrofolate reductase
MNSLVRFAASLGSRSAVQTKRQPSSTLDSLKWANSSFVTGDLAEAVAKLKEQPGKNILISGSPALVRSLLRDGLLDELGLMVHPCVLGSGERVFDEMSDRVALKLIDSTTFSTGVLSVKMP